VRAVVFGTAGHIDHGKTSVVKALTGVDCDRLPEEKRRGITLVLGFAPFADPEGELELSFIDVPGHERLVHTMIAGAAGIDRALLVVAADEGVMPQTREHLDILELLGVRGGVVALTKADLLGPTALQARRQELLAALAEGPLAGSPVIPCSAVSDTGLGPLREAILQCARGVVREEEPHRPFRLAVDRVFTLPGVGTVVTGTAHWGRVREGDELLALPGDLPVRVRGVQVYGESRPEAVAGERVALRLAGASVQELPRGEQLLSSGNWRPAQRLALSVRLVGEATLTEGDRVWLHLLAARVPARVERLHPFGLAAAASGRAILRLARPVFAVPGDRVVLRRVSPMSTLGGGEVLDVQPPRLRRREAAALAELPRPWQDLPATVLGWVAQAGPKGAAASTLAARLGVREAGLEALLGRLVAEGALAVAQTRPPLLVQRRVVMGILEKAREVLTASGSVGLPLAELLARVVPTEAGRLRNFYLDELRRSGVLREVAGRAFAGDTAPLEDALAARVAELYRQAGFEAPSPGEVAAVLGADPRVVQGVVGFLVDQKRLARVGGKWVVHRELLDEVAAAVQAWAVESFEVGAFKERFGLTRKLAIPILEWLDSQRVTRREGDQRRIVRRRAGTTPLA
jgi:selenocysteine-specific elongation factor